MISARPRFVKPHEFSGSVLWPAPNEKAARPSAPPMSRPLAIA
jgi:hypothetical protein